MPWNIPVFDSAGKIKDARIAVQKSASGNPITQEIQAFGFIPAFGAVRAFPGAEGFGTETTHGRGGVVYQVTNLNDSGAGSARAAFEATAPGIVIFRVSGTIILDDHIIINAASSNKGIFGQTAPGGGICFRASASMSNHLIQIGPINDGDGIGDAHDVVLQHLRLRHGSLNRGQIAAADSLDIFAGSKNIVIDHCSGSWCSDETFTIFTINSDKPDPHVTTDITYSHCLVAEGDDQHNTGMLISGTQGIDDKNYNLMLHHNLTAHLNFRDPLYSGGSGDSTKGLHQVNNIHYDCLQHGAYTQTQYVNQQAFTDAVNNLFIRSSRNNANGPSVFKISRLYTGTGRDGKPPAPWDDNNWTPHAFDHSKRRRPPPDIDQDEGVWLKPSIYGVGNLQREVDLSTIPSRIAGEADNELFVTKQFKGLATGDGGPFDGGEEYEWRTTPMTFRPVNEVTVQATLDAYTNVITNGNVGAFPHDAVDARIVASVIAGTIYDRTNVPGDPGGLGESGWPTLVDTGAFLDTSGNGLPDYYQVGVLSKSAEDTYNPANTFTIGNGYCDIENWIHSLKISISTIPTIQLIKDSTHDMSQYINDPMLLRTDTAVKGLTSHATYDPVTELLTGVGTGTEVSLTLEVTF